MSRSHDQQYKTRVASIAIAILSSVSWIQATADETKDYANSIQVVVDRQSAAQLTVLDQAIANKDYNRAAIVLQELLDRPNNSGFVPIGTSYQSAAAIAADRLRDLPTKALDAYERHVGNSAQRELARLLDNRRRRDFVKFISQYEFTNSGLRALQLELAHQVNRGRTTSAQRTLIRLLAHPRCTVATKQSSIKKLILGCMHSNDAQQAAVLLRQYSSLLQDSAFDTRIAEDLRATNVSVKSLTKSATETTVLDLPASKAAWQYDLRSESELETTLLRESMQELRNHGIVSLPVRRPRMIAGVLVAKTAAGLVGLDPATGQPKWRLDFSSASKTTKSAPSQLMNVRGFRARFRDALIQRLQIDSVFGTLTTDGRLLFTVNALAPGQPVQSTPFEQSNHPLLSGASSTASRLVAVNAATGEVVWNSGTLNQTTAGISLKDAYFVGPPTVHGESLYVVISAATSDSARLHLVQLEAATGRIESSIPIARGSQDITVDRMRRFRACRVSISGSQALCGTGAGAVVSVDLFRRSVDWVFRYARDDISPKQPNPANANRPQRHAWWKSWRTVELYRANSTNGPSAIILASPEAREIFALNSKTGKLLWKQPREDRLYVGGVFNGRLIVVGRREVEALDPSSGKLLWKQPSAQPAATGYASTSHYVLPLADGRTLACRFHDGKAIATNASSPAQSAGIIATDDGYFAQTEMSIRKHEDLGRALSAARSKAADRSGFVQLASISREAGMFDETLTAYQSAIEFPRRRGDLDDAEIDLGILELRLGQLQIKPESWRAVSSSLLKSTESVQHKIDVLHALARAAVATNDRSDAIGFLLELRQLDPIGMQPVPWDDHHRVRFDRLLQGELLDIFDGASSQQASRCAEQIEQFLSEQAAGQDPFALQRLADRFSHLRWGQRMRIQNPRATNIGIAFHQRQLRWLSMVQSPFADIATGARRNLSNLFEGHSYPDDAATELRALHSSTRDSTLARRLAITPYDDMTKRAFQFGTTSQWPNEPVQVEEREQQNGSIYYLRIPVKHRSGSYLSQLNVSLERGGRRTLRFQGAEHPGFWKPIDLPKSRSPFRYLINTYQGWSFGHVLILKIGIELFGITPINENGEPRATLLWSRAMADSSSWDSFESSSETYGESETIFRDQAGNIIGRVGVVRPGYICFHSNGKVIAIDTATGARLWETGTLSGDVDISGDDQWVFLQNPKSKLIEVRRALDGRTLEARKLPDKTYVDWVVHQGRQWIGFEKLAQDAESSRMFCYDIVEEKTVWSRRFQVGSKPFVATDELIGIVEPDKQLSLLWQVSGETFCRHQVAAPKPLKKIVTTTDSNRLYVVLSGEIANPRNLAARQIYDGYRNLLVNGYLHAIDLFATAAGEAGPLNRPAGSIAWSRKIEDACFLQDQVASAPFLILNYRKPAPGSDDGKIVDGITTLIDKRTGKLVYDAPGSMNDTSFDVFANPSQSWLDIRFPRRTLRISFGADVKESESN